MTQPFADALTWVPKSRALGTSLARANDLARAQGHALVDLEHLLLALIEDADAAAVLLACNVDLLKLNGAVSAHLQQQPGAGSGMPEASPAIVTILEYAVAAARQSRRNEVNGAIVLAAIVGEGRSVAAQMLQSQGLTFDDAVQALKRASAARPGADAPPASQTTAKPAPSEPPPSSPPPRVQAVQPGHPTDDDPITTARRRVEAIRTGQPLPSPVQTQSSQASARERAGASEPSQAGDWAPQPTAPLPPATARQIRMPPPVPPLPSAPARATGSNGNGTHAAAPWTDPSPATAVYTPGAYAETGSSRTGIPIDAARLSETIPKRMRNRSSVTVEVRISRSAVLATAAALGAAPDAALTRALAVRLKGPAGGFHIETAAPETQWFDTRSTARDENEVRWRWIVTPHKSGERPLQLAIAMRTITADGMVLETTLPEHPVSVRVSGRRGANLRAFGGWAVAALVGASVALLGTGSWMVVIAAIGRWFG